MTTTEAHHEIARSVKVLGDLDVSPKHKFLLKAHCEKILEHALAMRRCRDNLDLSPIHISEPTRLLSISYAVFCLQKKTT